MNEAYGIISLVTYMVIMIGLIVFTKNRRAMDKRLRALGLALDLVFTANVVLFALLLAVPYMGYHSRTYLSVNDCFDPRCWPPFGFEGFGLFLYETSFGIWVFAAMLVAPLILLQTYVLKRLWQNIGKGERVVHAVLICFTSLVSLFVLTAGQSIFTWLLD